MLTLSTDVPRDQYEAAADAEIEEFNAWFCAQGNDRLSRPERAILKTFLAFKLLGKKEG